MNKIKKALIDEDENILKELFISSTNKRGKM